MPRSMIRKFICLFIVSNISHNVLVESLTLGEDDNRIVATDLFLSPHPPYEVTSLAHNSIDENKLDNLNPIRESVVIDRAKNPAQIYYDGQSDSGATVNEDQYELSDVSDDSSNNEHVDTSYSQAPIHERLNSPSNQTKFGNANNENDYHNSMMFVLDKEGETPGTVDPDLMPAAIDHNVEPIINQLLGPRSPDDETSIPPETIATTKRRRRRRRRTTTVTAPMPSFGSTSEPIFGLPSTPEYVTESPKAVNDDTKVSKPLRERPSSTIPTPFPTKANEIESSSQESSTKTTTAIPVNVTTPFRLKEKKIKNPLCPANGSAIIEHPRACDKYYVCEEGAATLKTCPNGLLFRLNSFGNDNVIKFYFDHCVDRWNAGCGDKHVPDPISSRGCRWQFDKTHVQGAPKCSIDYYECRFGKFEVKRCEIKGQMWSERTKSCQWAEEIGCNNEALANFECPKEDSNNTFVPESRHYLTETDIIVCINRKPEVLHCTNGQRVNPEQLRCVDPLSLL